MIKELEESLDMIDRIRYGFKIKNNMLLDEKETKCELFELQMSLIYSNEIICEKNNNMLEIKIDMDMPTNFNTKYMIIKRVLNNLISNSLKHTFNNNVYVNFEFMESEYL